MERASFPSKMLAEISLKSGSKNRDHIHDAILWSSIIPLSKQSVNNGNIPIEFPDFENHWL